MPIFEYRGRNVRGEAIAGNIDSADPAAVANWLLDSGIQPVTIKERRNAQARPQWLTALLGQPHLSHEALLLLTRQLAIMEKAGVPLLQALSGIEGSATDPALMRIVRQIRIDLDRGMSLSGALARHPKTFSEFYVGMVRVGEDSGQLEAILRRIYEQLSFEKEMGDQIKSALRYPTFVVIAIGVALVVLSVFVIPIFARLFVSMKAELPLMTRVLIGASNFMVGYWSAVIAVGFTGHFLFRSAIRTPEGRYRWDKYKLRVPLVGALIFKATMARFAFTFALSNKSGVPLLDVFAFSSRVAANDFFRQRIEQMQSGVQRGESMLSVAHSSGLFKSLELQMISAGETAGELDAMLLQVAEMYQADVSLAVKRLSQSIEPVMVALMAGLVMVLMLGIFLPLWDMGQMARQ